MKASIKLWIFFAALGVIFVVSSQPSWAKSTDASWISGVDFKIYATSTLEWNVGNLVCSATLTDDNAQTVGCTGGELQTSYTYRVQMVIKSVGVGSALQGKDPITDYVAHMETKGGWAGSNPILGSCGYNDFDTDDDISATCSAAFVGNNVQLTNPNASGGAFVQASDSGTNRTEGFMYIITTGSDATSASTSYVNIVGFGGDEDSIKIGINFTPPSLSCSVIPSTLSFGTLTTSSVSETTDTATTTITAAGAVSITINGASNPLAEFTTAWRRVIICGTSSLRYANALKRFSAEIRESR